MIGRSGSLVSTLGYLNPFRYRGYVYDEETGLYYLRSRYYNPEWGRFVNADVLLGECGTLLSHNLFAYCAANPTVRKEIDGKFWDTIFDIASLAYSIFDVACNPTDVEAWIGLAGDVIDLIPGITGVGETVRTLRTTGKIVKNGEVVIDSYETMRKISKGTDLQAHHIIEKRLYKVLPISNTDEMLSIVLTKSEHQRYTNEWRRVLRYGREYAPEQILEAATIIYGDRPELLGAAWVQVIKK